MYTSAFYVKGVATSVKALMDHFPGPVQDKNSTSQGKSVMAPSRFNVEVKEKPKTLKEYLNELSVNSTSELLSISTNNQDGGRVVVVARIGDYDKETDGGIEWKVLSEPTSKNVSLNNFPRETEDYFENGLDYLLQKNDLQKHVNDYQDLLYTFKDFVKIGVSPNIKEKINEKMMLNLDEKIFNVTYVMPIPKTKKYFEIKMSNLTESQYNEINILLEEHMRNKTKIYTSQSKEEEILYVDIGDEKKQVTSRDLTEFSSLPDLRSLSVPPQTNMFQSNLPHNPDEAMAFFKKIFTEKGFNELVNRVNQSSSPTLNSPKEFLTQTVPSTSKTTAPLMRNNGFHAEIATDYVHKHDTSDKVRLSNSFTEDQNNTDIYSSTKHSSNNSSNKGSQTTKTEVNDSFIGTATTILNPVYTQRNITKLSPIPWYRRPVTHQTNATQRRKTSSDVSFEHTELDSPTLKPISDINAESNLDAIITPTPPILDKRTINNLSENLLETTNKTNLIHTTLSETRKANITENVNPPNINKQDWSDILKLYNNGMTHEHLTTVLSSLNSSPTPNESPSGTTDKPLSTNSLSIMQAANWIIEMKKKIEEEERKKNERYKNYIKKFLGGDDDSVFLGREEDGKVMKINKQDNILEELKLLMLDYFASLNFNTQEMDSNRSSVVESILNATNIFELMERSSQLVKLNLKMKMQTETKEPSGFVKKIVDGQVEKCKQIFNSTLFSKARQKSPEFFKKNSHRRFLVFTKCMNFKLKRCIKGFSMWLERGKFYLRPQFKLDRAYENYEIERNLYCVRSYNASSLDSHLHGIRVRPRTRVNRKSGMRRMRTGQSKTRFRIRKIRNGGQKGSMARRNMAMNRRYNNRQENFEYMNDEHYRQQPLVQLNSDTQEPVYIRRENGGRNIQQSESRDIHSNNL